MNGNDALKMAMALMHETDKAPYADFAAPMLNVVLGELYDIANRRAQEAGNMPFSGVPTIDSLDDALPFDDEMNVRLIPLGLLCRLYAHETDRAMLDAYVQQYADTMAEMDRATVRIVGGHRYGAGI